MCHMSSDGCGCSDQLTILLAAHVSHELRWMWLLMCHMSSDGCGCSDQLTILLAAHVSHELIWMWLQ